MKKRNDDGSYGNQPPELSPSNPVDAAIGMIRGVGEAIRDREARTVHALSEVEETVRALQERVEQHNARADGAEQALQAARAEIAALVETLTTAQSDLASLKDQVVAKGKDLTIMDGLAEAAERRAAEKAALLSLLIEEVRAKLPANSEAPPRHTS